MKNYLIRLWNVILFLFIWIGIPYQMSDSLNDNTWYVLLLFTWLPAGYIVIYLADKQSVLINRDK